MPKHNSASFPTYVSFYNMTGEPFSDNAEDGLFYAEPTRKQKLDILLHLTQYGNELMLVTGPDGCGKTTLLQQFQRQALDTWKIARIDAKTGIDERKLIQQLFHQMNLEFHGATHTELLEQLERHFDSLQHSTHQAVLLIDNAEQLPVTALNRALELASLNNTDNKPLLRVILFGNEQLEANFSDPLLGQQASIVRRSIELPAFTQEHTAHYILHRLSAVQFVDNKLFTESALHKIHKQSHGWPKEINRLAHNLLIETLPNTATSKSLSTFKLPRAAAALAGITAISALLFYQDEFNTWLDAGTTSQITGSPSQPSTQQLNETITMPLALPSTQEDHQENTMTPGPHPEDATIMSPPLAATSEDSPTETLAFTDAQKAAIASELNTKVNTEINAEEPNNIPITLETTNPAAQPDITLSADANTIEPDNNVHSPDAASQPTTASTVTASTHSSLPLEGVPSDLPGKRQAWILQQNPSHYTLQLVAGNNIETLHKYIQRYSPQSPFAIYRSTRENQPWYGLVYNSFASKQQAFNAVKQLPKQTQRQKPWVREWSALQNELSTTPPKP